MHSNKNLPAPDTDIAFASEAVFFPSAFERRHHLRRDRRAQRRIAAAAVLLLWLELPVDGGVDQDAGPLTVAVLYGISLLRGHARIEHGARRSRKHRDIAEAGVEPVTERPLDRFPIVNVDIVVDHDQMLSRVIG